MIRRRSFRLVLALAVFSAWARTPGALGQDTKGVPVKSGKAKPDATKARARLAASPAAAPEGFDKRREGIPRGKVETVEYDSTTVGTRASSSFTRQPDSPRMPGTRFCTCFTGSATTKQDGHAKEQPAPFSITSSPTRKRCR